MKELLISLPASLAKGSSPKYQRLADAIRSRIRDGSIKPGELLPSSRDMAKKLKINRHTVMNALAELESEGWITAEEKRFYKIVSTLPSTFLRPKEGVPKKLVAKTVSYQFARPVGLPEYDMKTGFKFMFPSGFPDIRMFPMKELKSHMYDALKSNSVLSYGDPAGHKKLITQIETYLRRVRNVEDREIVVTNGSQEAIFLISQLFIRPGDFVAVEELGYPPAVQALRFAGAQIVPIRVDSEGLNVDDLELQIKKKKVKFLYTTPLHQYPTTVSLSASRRLRLYELACKHGMLIIEDDYDHEFHYSSQPTAPLACFDPAGIILYISTFSKILFPSARIGFMAVPKLIRDEIAKLKRISSRQNEQILQDAIARWMASGGFEKHLRKMRRTYEERRNAFVEVLEEVQKEHPEISWSTPDGGMALWLNVNTDSKKLAAKVALHGILVNPEENYRLDGRTGTHLRLGFSGQTVHENERGLQALFSTL